MRALLILLVIILDKAAWAAGGSSDGVPTDFVIAQVINFLLAGGLLVYLLKSKVVEHFKERRASYTEFMSRAERAMKEAEEQKKLYEDKLNNLKQSEQETLAQARADAEELKQRLVSEAKATSEKLIEDAKKASQYEVEKAKAQLKDVLLEEAIKAADKALQQKVGDAEQEKLRSEFVSKIQVVQ
ncbi:MAG: ATP synthase F0 subunit B [Bdellovibrionales bacterium]|nr:ATP synthase F0 subunit B [Bdellovibrionales bacterium]